MKALLQDIKKVSIYDIAVFFLYLCCGMVVTTALLFIIGIEIGWLNFIVPLLLTGSIFFYREDDRKKAVWIIILSLIIFFLLISASANVFDYTWDGAWYHKTAVGLLKNGWNPLYLSAEKFNNISNNNVCATQSALKWAECYPKATWYFGGIIYFLTKNIEAGKAYTMIYMVILFGMIYHFVDYKLKRKWKAAVIAGLATFNPIALCQMLTYYNDGVSGCILVALMLQLILLFEKDYPVKKEEIYINITALIIMGCNLKFSITAYTAIICIVAFIMLVIKSREKKYCISLFSYFAVSAFIAIAVVGMTPYLTNIARYKNMLYGFSGMLETGSLENSFGIEGLGSVGTAIASLFGRMGNNSYHSLGELLKIPFTFSKNEFYYYSISDARTGGFGVFFSGLFLVSVVIILLWILKSKITLQKVTVVLFLVVLVLEYLFLPGTFAARYIPHFYLILPLAVYLLIKEEKKDKKVCIRFAVNTCLVLIAIANIIPWFNVAKKRIKEGAVYQAELMNLSKQDYENMTFAFWYYDYSGLYYNLQDYGIEVKSFVDKADLQGEVKCIYGEYISYVYNE